MNVTIQRIVLNKYRIKKIIVLLLIFNTNLYSQIKIKKSIQDVAEKLIELNPANFNSDFSNYNQSTALYCAQLSDLAYWDSTSINWLVDKLNIIYPGNKVVVSFIEVKKLSAQAVLWCINDNLIISWRGTEFTVFRDILSDVKFFNYRNSKYADFKLNGLLLGHGGFRRSIIDFILKKDIYTEIDNITKKRNPVSFKECKIFMTGHSLGAGLSQAFVNPLITKKYNFQGAYNFAPPLSVDCSYRKSLIDTAGNKVYDIINYKDYVPRAGRKHVQHFGKFYRISKDGMIYKEKESYCKFSLGEYRKEVHYHRIQNHIKAIRLQCNSLLDITTRSGNIDYPTIKPTKELEFCPN